MVDLGKMRKLMKQLPRKLRAIDDAMERATKITPTLSGMPHGSGVNSKVEESAIDVVMAKAAYKDVLDKLDEMRQELEPYIDQIEDCGIRVCMRLRYIQGLSVYDNRFTNTACLCERVCYRKLEKGEAIVQKLIGK